MKLLEPRKKIYIIIDWLYKTNIINEIKSSSLRWADHVVWMDDNELPKMILWTNPGRQRECKSKGFPNRPGVAQRVPGGLGSKISMTFGTWRWWMLSASFTGPLYPQEMFLVLIFTRGWVDPRAMVRSEGICHWKIQWHHRESIPGPSD
jgi:hypothetical protein